MNVRVPFGEPYNHGFVIVIGIAVFFSVAFAIVFWRKRFF